MVKGKEKELDSTFNKRFMGITINGYRSNIEITAEAPKVKNVVFLCSVHTSSASTLLLKCKQTDHITA